MHLLEQIATLLPRRSSICLSATGVHCDHTVHCSADLSVWLHSPVFWTPWHQSMSTYSQPSFSSSTWKRGGLWMCQLSMISEVRLKAEFKLLLSANRKSYMQRRSAQQRMTLGDLEWPFYIGRYLCGSWASCYHFQPQFHHVVNCVHMSHAIWQSAQFAKCAARFWNCACKICKFLT